MKIDMHYYGTFAMARAAGINEKSAQIIASAAQYIDEAVESQSIELDEGSCLVTFPTAHHMKDKKNVQILDQRQVWVPFHFLPGAEGETFSERMVCQKNSEIAKKMVAHHIDHATAEFGLELIGVTAHVYADTFAHYGFSGLSSRQNKVKGESIEVEIDDPAFKESVLDKLTGFFSHNDEVYPNFRRKFISGVAEELSRGLGHAGVATYPDLPFLWWCFDYEEKNETSGRKNDETFLEGCRALHEMFTEFLRRNPQYSDPNGALKFEDIQEVVKRILSVEKDTKERGEEWRIAMWRGELTPVDKQEVPEYVEEGWTADLEGYKGGSNAAGLRDSSVFKFFQAANFHRNYILRELLPENGLLVY